MSTLLNDTRWSFNVRRKQILGPFDDLITDVQTEELGHIGVVAATLIEALAADGRPRGGNRHAAIEDRGDGECPPRPDRRPDGAGRPRAQADEAGQVRRQQRNEVLDMLDNRFRECGAWMGELRVHESLDNPVARELCGYLLTHDSVHGPPTKALQKLSGIGVGMTRSSQNISGNELAEATTYHDQRSPQILYRSSPEDGKGIVRVRRAPTRRTASRRRRSTARPGTVRSTRRRRSSGSSLQVSCPVGRRRSRSGRCKGRGAKRRGAPSCSSPHAARRRGVRFGRPVSSQPPVASPARWGQGHGMRRAQIESGKRARISSQIASMAGVERVLR